MILCKGLSCGQCLLILACMGKCSLLHSHYMRIAQSPTKLTCLAGTVKSFTPEHPHEARIQQSCPLSPTLFGFFLDGLQRYVIVDCPTLGPGLSNGIYVPCLVHADDIALMATTASGLQALIDAPYAFCDPVGLADSPLKSNVVVFSKLIVGVPVFSCHSGAVP